MDPEEYDDAEMAGLPLGSASTNEFGALSRVADARVVEQMRSNMAMLLAGRDNLRAQRTGPSDVERLLAISSAFSRPTRTGSFGESLGNVTETLGAQEKAKREAAFESADLAQKYGMQIGNEQLRLLMQNQTGAYRREDRAAAIDAAKLRANKRRTAISAVDGRVYDLDTGAIVEPESDLPVFTPQQAAAAKAAGMRMRFRTTDGRELEI